MAQFNHLFDKFQKEYEQKLGRSRARWSRMAAALTEKEILRYIARGESPVAGQGKFKPYRKSYRQSMGGTSDDRHFRIINGNVVPFAGSDPEITKYGKRASVVNLKLSGKMLRSIKKRVTKKGFSIWFSSKIMKYHQEGTDKMERRATLPNVGEQLKLAIQKKLKKLFRMEIAKIFR